MPFRHDSCYANKFYYTSIGLPPIGGILLFVFAFQKKYTSEKRVKEETKKNRLTYKIIKIKLDNK